MVLPPACINTDNGVVFKLRCLRKHTKSRGQAAIAVRLGFFLVTKYKKQLMHFSLEVEIFLPNAQCHRPAPSACPHSSTQCRCLRSTGRSPTGTVTAHLGKRFPKQTASSRGRGLWMTRWHLCHHRPGLPKRNGSGLES